MSLCKDKQPSVRYPPLFFCFCCVKNDVVAVSLVPLLQSSKNPTYVERAPSAVENKIEKSVWYQKGVENSHAAEAQLLLLLCNESHTQSSFPGKIHYE